VSLQVAHLSAEADCETSERIVLLLVFIVYSGVQRSGDARAGPSPGFSSRGSQTPKRGAKNQKGGATFLKYSIGYMQQPGGQT